MNTKYDVTIIGAGMGGLVCACALAQRGLKVLVVEKNRKVGGCVSTIISNGFHVDMGAHLIGGCDSNGLFNYHLRKLGVKVDLIKLNPFDRFIFSDDIIEIPPSLEEYILLLQKKFPSERDNIKSFFDAMIKIYRKCLSGQEKLKQYRAVTYQVFLNSFIKNSKLKGVLSGQCPYIGVPPDQASVVAASFMMISYLRDGVYYVKGGSQNLPDSLEKKILEYGGKILYSTKIEKIEVENRTAVGVFFSENQYVGSKFVVSNIDGHSTFRNLIGYENLEKKFITKFNKMKKGASCIKMHICSDMHSNQFQKALGWHFRSYDINRCFENSLYVFVPTFFDETVAPRGKSIIQMLKIFPSCKNKDNWHKIKSNVEQSFLRELEKKLCVNIRKRISTVFISGPKDIEHFTGNSCGSVFGWEMSPKQMLDRRLGNVTPISNLYLTGHWTNPGCGVLGAATSGMITANRILEQYEKEI